MEIFDEEEEEPLTFGRVNNFPYTNWMSYISNDRLLSDMSIPGTHDSGTALVALAEFISFGPATTQNFTIKRQLNDGIRFLDIRVKIHNETSKLQLFHGNFNCHVSFDEVLDWCKTFLRDHPSEVIMMHIANEDDDEDITDNLNIYFNHSNWKNMFYTDKCIESMPRLGDVRGKIVVFKGFKYQEKVPHFIDLYTNWGGAHRGSSTFSFPSSYEAVIKGKEYFQYYISDEFNEHDTDDKYKKVIKHLNDADNGNSRDFYITFNSIAFNSSLHTPYQYAWAGYEIIFGIQAIDPIMNPAIRDYLAIYLPFYVMPQTEKRFRWGAIMLDYYNNKEGSIENELVQYIILSNNII